jgi:hypothetical protein
LQHFPCEGTVQIHPYWWLFIFIFFFNLGVFILNYIFYQSMQGNIISSPATSGTILPGVTRRSIIEIALDHGYQVFIFLKEGCMYQRKLKWQSPIQHTKTKQQGKGSLQTERIKKLVS